MKRRSNPTPNFLQLHFTFHWCFLLLHRPFCRRRSRAVLVQENVFDHLKVRQMILFINPGIHETLRWPDLQAGGRRDDGFNVHMARALYATIRAYQVDTSRLCSCHNFSFLSPSSRKGNATREEGASSCSGEHEPLH